VLFLVFNRPEVTAQVFDAIRAARPPRLYIAADGPRPGRDGEAERVAQTRAIATAVDWPCEVKTLFRDENLGCKMAVSCAITWFFGHEESGIVLEDDCLPHLSFFRYCEWALSEFRENRNIWHISGNNFDADRSLYTNFIDFSSLPQVWGWATWSDRWKHFQSNPFAVSHQSNRRRRGNWLISARARYNKMRHIDALKDGLNTWDYQWQVAVLNKKGLCVTSQSNLISNLGDGPDATHTIKDVRARLPVREFIIPKKYTISLNKPLTRYYEKQMGLRSYRGALKQWAKMVKREIKNVLKRVARLILFGNCTPIVIASSGRSGSTMLADCVTASFIEHRFRRVPRTLRKIATRFAFEYVDRLEDVENNVPVVKTHDIYRASTSRELRPIFVFGPALEAMVSAKQVATEKGSIWLEEHIFHLCGDGDPAKIYDEDVLNYQAQLESWSAADNVFLVHYDDIWENADRLSDFVGFPLNLPPRKERRSKTKPADYNEYLVRRLADIEHRVRNCSQRKEPS